MAAYDTRVWEITATHTVLELHLQDHTNLDAVTRQLPDGFYTTFRTYAHGTRVVGLSAHLARVFSPVDGWPSQPACSETELRRVLDREMEAFRPQETRIRVSVEGKSGKLYFTIQPLLPPSPNVYTRGVSLVTTRAKRSTPSLKMTTFIHESQAERKAVASTSAYEGLITRNYRILEGLTSNFFYIRGGELCTAGRGVLPGITRGEILVIARKSLSIPIRYRALRVDQITSAEEAFICSSSREIVPVVRINDETIGTGEVGSFTRKLMEAYKHSVMERSETFI